LSGGRVLAGKIAKRYASALFSIAQSRSIETETGETPGEFCRIVDDSDELRGVFHSPRFNQAEKKRIVDRIFKDAKGDGVELVHRFIDMLIEKHRIEWLDQIHSVYIRIMEQSRGLHRAGVTTAFPLDTAVRERLRKLLEKITGGEVVLVFRENPNILGGFVISIEGKSIDASLKYRLQKLREDLLSIPVHT
jgi:F-type H+-transporting ATPase subunit delta